MKKCYNQIKLFCNKYFTGLKLFICSFFLIVYLILAGENSFAQLSSQYTYSYIGTNANAYNATPTILQASGAVGNDAVFTSQAIGFSFQFNCVTYTTIGISANGFIWFGTGTCSATQYTPLSSTTGETGTVDGIISGFGANLVPHASGASPIRTLNTKLTGVSPNQVLTIEWRKCCMTGATTNPFDIQIKLFETTNKVEIRLFDNGYGLSGTTAVGQVGMRGTTANFVNRSTAAVNLCTTVGGGVNTATCSIVPTFVCNYAYSGSGAITFNYAFSGSCCTTPTTNGSAGSATNITNTQCDISFTRGNGTGGVLVVARANATTAVSPANGTAYASPSTIFGSGTITGASNYSVYNGAGNGTGVATTPITITNLTPGTTYAFDVYEYNTTSICYFSPKYTFTVAIPLCLPPTTQATSPIATPTGTTTETLSWTAGNGTGGEFVILNQGSAVATDPTQNTAYTANATFGSGSLIGTGRVIYASNTGSVNITNLTLNTTYYYAIYTFNSSGPCYKTPPLTGSFTTTNGPMTYSSSTTVQQLGNIAQGASNQALIQVSIVTGPGTSPALSLSSLTFNTNGSTLTGTLANDITAARIWYTGTSSTFATTTQFGSDIISFPGGSTAIPVTGSQTLAAGTNYFWVAYDANISATVGDVLDAECTSINIGSIQTPGATAPAGTRPVVALASLSCAYTGSSQAITYANIVGGASTLIASGSIDDQLYPSQSFPAGFTFEFNGAVYSSYGISANGFIWFGTGTPGATYASYGGTPVGSASANLGGSGTIAGILAAAGADLINHYHLSAAPTPAQINIRTTGVAPNRIVTIEWVGFQAKSIGSNGTCWFALAFTDESRLDFQIKLYENGTAGTSPNRIEMSYRDQSPFCMNDAFSFQIGIRGSSNTDYLTRANTSHLTSSSTTNGGTAAIVITLSTVWINGASVGIRFQPNISTPLVSPSPTAANICPATSVTLTGSATVPASPSWQWYKNGVSIPSATASTYSVTATGTFVLVASNAGCGRVSTATVVTITPCCVAGTWTGTVSADWNTAGNWCGNIIPVSTTNVIINSGTPNDPLVSGVGPVATCNNLTINTGASVSIASNTLNLKGDLILSPTGFFVHYGGTLELNGTSTQTIPDITCYDLKINNSAGVVISGDVMVNHNLNLASGILSTGGSIITVSNATAGSVFGFSATSYINGRLIRYVNNGNFDLPIGDATNYQLATVTVNGLSPTIYLLAEYFSDNTSCSPVPNGGGGPYVNGSPLFNLLDAGFWTITPDVQPTSGTYDIQLKERGYTNSPISAAYCAVIKRDDCASIWQSLGVHTNATQSISSGTVTAFRSALTSFSDFGIGFGGIELPIQLSSFTADYCDNNFNSILKWTTSSELNCDYFELEVATELNNSGDLNFKKIGQVDGSGTASVENNYSFIDYELNKTGKRYYRLKEVDLNGEATYSNIVSLSFGIAPVISSVIFPNPASEFLNYEITLIAASEVSVSITNILGQEVFVEYQKLKTGKNNLALNIKSLPEGFYYLNISLSGLNDIHRKFEKFNN